MSVTNGSAAQFNNRSSYVSEGAGHQGQRRGTVREPPRCGVQTNNVNLPMVLSKQGPPSEAHLGNCADEMPDEECPSQGDERPDPRPSVHCRGKQGAEYGNSS